MPRLIIPNGLDLQHPENYEYSADEAYARQFYNSRFLWLLDENDIIVLPQAVNPQFLLYMANIKQLKRNAFTVIPWHDAFTSPTKKSLSSPNLLSDLQCYIQKPDQWTIHACFFNPAILALADQLQIPIEPIWRNFVAEDMVRRLNSKAMFRHLAAQKNLPVTKGQTCGNLEQFHEIIESIIGFTGQVIVKQSFCAGGRGNIGISNKQAKFSGTYKNFLMTRKKDIDNIANDIWASSIDDYNLNLIVEVYYPTTGTFTTLFFIPSSNAGPPNLLNYSEIRMEKLWIGVETPAHALSPIQFKQLITASKEFATALQAYGYQGYACFDAIRTIDNEILFTEINVRPGAETHAHILGSHLFGEKYYEEITFLTRRNVKLNSFAKLQQALQENELLLNQHNRAGVIILTIDEEYANNVELMSVGKNIQDAYRIEKCALELLK